MAGMTRRGAALLVVLMFMIILAVLLKALIYLSSHQAFATRGHYERIAGHFVLEAAVADALVQLEDDARWTRGFSNKPLEDVAADYTIVFNTTGRGFRPDDSVNNLRSYGPADGPRGPDTVATRSAELGVTARVGATVRKARVVVGQTLFEIAPYAVTASRGVTMKGSVEVTGVKDLRNSRKEPAGIHSNSRDRAGPLITWEPKDSRDRALVDGSVSVSSADEKAIDFGADPSAYSVANFYFNTPRKPTPRLNIAAEVQSNRRQKRPPIEPLGTSELRNDRFAQLGDLDVNGDLVLENTTLYVDGDLNVNGTVSGDGAIYVTGQTRFRGNSDVRTNNPYGVALFSKGSLRLEGFDGTALLETLAKDDPQLQKDLSQYQMVVADMNAAFAAYPAAELMAGGSQYPAMQAMRVSLGEADPAVGTPYKGTSRDLLGRMASRLQSYPSGKTRDFLISRMWQMKGVFQQWGGKPKDKIADWNGGGNSWALFDAALRFGDPASMDRVVSQVRQLGFNRPGLSYFQGLVYTNGFLYANHEVSIVGATWAHDDGSQAAEVLENTEIRPGDIFLGDGVKLTFVEEYLEGGGGPGAALPLGVKAWFTE